MDDNAVSIQGALEKWPWNIEGMLYFLFFILFSGISIKTPMIFMW